MRSKLYFRIRLTLSWMFIFIPELKLSIVIIRKMAGILKIPAPPLGKETIKLKWRLLSIGQNLIELKIKRVGLIPSIQQREQKALRLFSGKIPYNQVLMRIWILLAWQHI